MANPKPIEQHKRLNSELASEQSKRPKGPRIVVPSNWDLVLIEKKGKVPPAQLCTFEDGVLAARLNWAIMLIEDYNTCAKLAIAAHREWLEWARYQVGH